MPSFTPEREMEKFGGKLKHQPGELDITDYGAAEDISGGLGGIQEVVAVVGLGFSDQDYFWRHDKANDTIVAKDITDTGDGTGGFQEAAAGADVGAQHVIVIGYG